MHRSGRKWHCCLADTIYVSTMLTMITHPQLDYFRLTKILCPVISLSCLLSVSQDSWSFTFVPSFWSARGKKIPDSIGLYQLKGKENKGVLWNPYTAFPNGKQNRTSTCQSFTKTNSFDNKCSAFQLTCSTLQNY